MTRHMVELFPQCPRINCVNISRRQLECCAAHLSDDQRRRVNLYLCNGQVVDLLPDPEVPYDLVIVRGVYTHFLPRVFEESVAQVFKRLAEKGTLIISDTLYRCDLATYKSPMPDAVDRLACGHRKSPEYFSNVLEKSGLTILDMQIMPLNTKVIYWL
ncbi:S-adenosylmethionine-dependent methyltransferase family protein [Metarhizium robertsii]|nr:S-adenosylmethionine-dependent methyltransferase family protein [Metarhizium robertsii]